MISEKQEVYSPILERETTLLKIEGLQIKNKKGDNLWKLKILKKERLIYAVVLF